MQQAAHKVGFVRLVLRCLLGLNLNCLHIIMVYMNTLHKQ